MDLDGVSLPGLLLLLPDLYFLIRRILIRVISIIDGDETAPRCSTSLHNILVVLIKKEEGLIQVILGIFLIAILPLVRSKLARKASQVFKFIGTKNGKDHDQCENVCEV